MDLISPAPNSVTYYTLAPRPYAIGAAEGSLAFMSAVKPTGTTLRRCPPGFPKEKTAPDRPSSE